MISFSFRSGRCPSISKDRAFATGLTNKYGIKLFARLSSNENREELMHAERGVNSSVN